MDVLILTVFVSLMLVLAAVLFFGWNVRNRSHEHAERLVLLPLQDEATTPREGSSDKVSRAAGRGQPGIAGEQGSSTVPSGCIEE